MGEFSALFEELAAHYHGAAIAFPALKTVTLAQWMLESGYGRSALAQDDLNFAGLKWRSEMQGFAEPVSYQAHDGGDRYCKFASLDGFIAGYWHFLDRAPYKGWRDRAGSPEAFIRFVAPIYTPTAGYADVVLSLLEKAGDLLARTDQPGVPPQPAGTSEAFLKPPVKAFIQSPNHSSRNGEKIRQIILHYTTARDVSGTLDWFGNPASQVSAHYIVARNGDIYQMVKDGDKAWHAKASNSDSIGIEHSAAQGDTLTVAQEAASVALIRWLLSEYKLNRAAITGHRFAAGNIGTTDCPHSLFGPRTEEALRNWVNAHF